MRRPDLKLQDKPLDPGIIAVIDALAKRAALADHQAEIARIQILTQTRAAASKA